MQGGSGCDIFSRSNSTFYDPGSWGEQNLGLGCPYHNSIVYPDFLEMWPPPLRSIICTLPDPQY